MILMIIKGLSVLANAVVRHCEARSNPGKDTQMTQINADEHRFFFLSVKIPLNLCHLCAKEINN
jgi:hypothetical protein